MPTPSQLENLIGQRSIFPWWHSPKPWIAVAIAIAVRVVLIFAWPSQSFSCDLAAWKTVAASALVGVNTYDKTVVLNWPPLWMEILFVLGKLANRFDWDFFTSIRLFLTAADAILVLSTYALLDVLQIRTDKFRLVLLGICLNPLLILLTIQQGNLRCPADDRNRMVPVLPHPLPPPGAGIGLADRRRLAWPRGIRQDVPAGAGLPASR